MSWPAIKKFFTQTDDFDAYVSALSTDSLAWAQFPVVHNTWNPTLAQRVAGRDCFADVQNPVSWAGSLERYYQKGPAAGGPADGPWSGGPHLYVTPSGILVFNDLTRSGIHSPSWNDFSWGVETVGDWDLEQPPDPLVEYLVSALTTLCKARNLDGSTIRFHFEDPETKHHHCPGANLPKADLIQRVQTRLSPPVCRP